MAAIQKAEETELDKNKAEILNQLKDELILRYQYKEGLYQNYLKNNSEIKKATQLLSNTSEYNKILKK
jgi:carboxyl-terminal processing protease